jgi:hypothetical protein
MDLSAKSTFPWRFAIALSLWLSVVVTFFAKKLRIEI